MTAKDDISDELKFRHFRKLDGSAEQFTTNRRNGRLFLNLPPDTCHEAAEPESPPLWEQARLYVNLNPVERATWEKILKGQPIKDISRDEGVSRQAIYSRIIGNSKGQGGMIAKNFWVLMWWLMRQRQNQSKDSI